MESWSNDTFSLFLLSSKVSNVHMQIKNLKNLQGRIFQVMEKLSEARCQHMSMFGLSFSSCFAKRILCSYSGSESLQAILSLC